MKPKHLALWIACLAAGATNTCLAADPAICLAACASEQQRCQGGVQPEQDRLMAAAVPERSARPIGTQLGQLRGANVLEIDNSTSSFKRLSQTNACQAGDQQCSRDCGRVYGAEAVGKRDRPAR